MINRSEYLWIWVWNKGFCYFPNVKMLGLQLGVTRIKEEENYLA
jgi:hypothetical protein